MTKIKQNSGHQSRQTRKAGTPSNGIENGSFEIINPSTMQFGDEDIAFVEKGGEIYYPVPSVGKMFGYRRENVFTAFRRNCNFLDGNYLELKLSSSGRARPVPCLTGEGVLIFAARLGVDKLPQERQDKVIKMVRYMAKVAMQHLKGELVPKQPTPQLDHQKWQSHRKEASKNWNILREELRRKVVPTIRDPSHERFVYMHEAKMLNKAVFGKHEKGIRDKSSLQQIEALANAQAWDTTLLHLGILDRAQRDVIVDDLLVKHYPDLDLEQTLPEPVQQKQLPVKISVSTGQTTLFEIMVGGAA